MNNNRAESMRVMCPLFHQAGEGGSIPTSALQLRIEPIDLTLARQLNRLWHSRLPRFSTGKCVNQTIPCFAAEFDGLIYAVAIWSNPQARSLPQREWLELKRLAIAPDAPRNTGSRMLRIMTMLLRRARPYIQRLISYQDTEVHTGSIYRAAGWLSVDCSGSCTDWEAGSKQRPRLPAQSNAVKVRWEKVMESKI